jgi:protein-S-isoprenylcysteine O-methyltransferase Ste14
LAYALIVNYVGVDVLSVAAIPMFYAIIVLEERELIDRFGATYREYQREVPRLVPRWRKTS